MERRVIEILPTTAPIIDETTGIVRKKRVAAYARVSTDFEDQLNSFENQKRTYEEKIQENPKWEFVGLYSDEGISGTSLKKRDGFNKMIHDALSGIIDLILVKSISRFARNTVDCIKTKRELEAAGVEVFFEKENISSLDSASETMLTIYASFAQEEARQISTNVTWGVRSRMREGTYRAFSRGVFGFNVDDKNNMTINPDQALIVKKIFAMFIDGYSYRDIANYLKENNVAYLNGQVKWNPEAILRILSNEKYCGDIIYQKTYTPNYLTHESKINDKKVSQYFFPEHHEPIISKGTFMLVQLLRERRNKRFNPTIDNGKSGPLSGLVYCASCGRLMKKITCHPGKPYSRDVLTCKVINKNKVNYIQCEHAKTIEYDVLLELMKTLVEKEYEVIDLNLLSASIKDAKRKVNTFNKAFDIQEEIKLLENNLNNLVSESTKSNIPFSEYKVKYEQLQMEIETKRKELDSISEVGFIELENKQFNEELIEFLQKKNHFSSRILHSIFKRIYRLKDNSLLIIKSKKKVDELVLERIRNNISDYLLLDRQVFVKNNQTIVYRILNLEEFNNDK